MKLFIVYVNKHAYIIIAGNQQQAAQMLIATIGGTSDAYEYQLFDLISGVKAQI